MWSANLFQMTSGMIGPQLNFSDISWSISLNDTENFSITLKKSDLPKIDRALWLTPTYAGVILFWNGQPIVGGPIVSRPHENFEELRVDCAGIRYLLDRRIYVAESSNWDNLAKQSIQLKGMSLGTIAKTVVLQTQYKPGGSLPITFPIADELVADNPRANHQRTYQGFNVQNLSVDDILTKLSNVINGPDIMFKPRLLSPNMITFDMWHGTENQPRIFQNRTPVWDTTAVMGPVVGAQVITTGDAMTSRVFSVGAGKDQGQIITVHTNSKPLGEGFPLIEKVVNSSNSEDKAVVAAHGVAALSANAKPKQQIQFTVRADDEVNFLGSFWPGDLVRLTVKGWVSLPDGTHDYRLLNINGDSSSNFKMALQPESQFIQDDLDEIE